MIGKKASFRLFPSMICQLIPAPRFHRVRLINIRRFRAEEKKMRLTQVRVGVRSKRREECDKIEAGIIIRPLEHVCEKGKCGT